MTDFGYEAEVTEVWDMTKAWWTMEDLEYETGHNRYWLKRNILEIPQLKKEIEQFSHYLINNND